MWLYVWEGVRKHIFLYQQYRFAKLGKAAAWIAQAYPILKTLFDETTSTNQLVEYIYQMSFCVQN